MKLRVLPKVECFLRAVTFEPSDDPAFERKILIPSIIVTTGDKHIELPEIAVWARECDGFGFEALNKVISDALVRLDHPSSAKIVGALLGLFMHMESRFDAPTQTFDYLLSQIKGADLTQLVIIPAVAANDFEISFGQFSVAPLNLSRLQQRSGDAGSDYAARSATRLQGRYAIERARHKRVALDYFVLVSKFANGSKAQNSRVTALFEAYFEFLSREYARDFWIEFDRQQEVQVSLGATYLPPRTFQEMQYVEDVTIFEKIGNHLGFVSPAVLRFTQIDIGNVETRLPELQKELRQLGFAGFGKNDLDQKLQSFIHYCFRGRQLSIEENFTEAFLHQMIALEVLVGEKKANVQTVSRRVAIIVYRELGESITTAAKRLSRLYDLRSKYVHAGVPIERSDTENLYEVTQAVIRNMFRLRRENKNATQVGFVEKWRTLLDLSWMTHKANYPMTVEMQTDLGLPKDLSRP